MRWSFFPLALSLLFSPPALSTAAQGDVSTSVRAADWQLYKQKFLDPSGRIIDTANGNISHSEGQGYGLLLAVKAGSRPDFDLIWSFTRDELLLRNDGLAAWKWDPSSSPHVTDPNNATDGDVLITYALALAARKWNVRDFADTSVAMADTIARTAIRENQGQLIILPATAGFDAGDRPDGPVINPSYWIFEAFPVLAALAPGLDGQKLASDGKAMLRQVSTGPRDLPPDWVSLRTMPKPAKGFAPEFGYNSLRVPLYLVRGGVQDRELLQSLATGMSTAGGVATFDLRSGEPRDKLTDAGYRIIPALVSCVLDRRPIPGDLLTFSPTAYYPSTLQLLALSYLAENPQACP